MSNTLNLDEITSQIQRYIRQIKKNTALEQKENFAKDERFQVRIDNDLRSNINKLDGSNKFKIQNMLEQNVSSAPSEYAAEAYGHLSELDDKKKVIIDYMHKNNRNYDVNI